MPVLADLLAWWQAGLNISLDSGSAEVYRAVKGVAGFDKVVANLGRYAEAASIPDVIELKYIVLGKKWTDFSACA